MLGWEWRNGCFHKLLVSNSAHKMVSFSSKKERKLLSDSMVTLSCMACQWVRWADGREKNTLRGGTKWNSKAPVTDNLSEWLIGNKPFLWVLRGTSWKDTGFEKHRVWEPQDLMGGFSKKSFFPFIPLPTRPSKGTLPEGLTFLSYHWKCQRGFPYPELAPISISKMSAGLESDTLWAHRWVEQNREPRNKLMRLWSISLQQRRQTIQWRKDSFFDNSMEGPQKTKNRTTIWSSNFTPEYMSRKRTKTLIQTNVPQRSLQHCLQQPVLLLLLNRFSRVRLCATQ